VDRYERWRSGLGSNDCRCRKRNRLAFVIADPGAQQVGIDAAVASQLGHRNSWPATGQDQLLLGLDVIHASAIAFAANDQPLGQF